MQQTTNYNLAKPEYTDQADIAPISGNMDTIDTALDKARGRDADIYNSNTSYGIGDFCIYQDTLYKCTGATTGSWDSSKWTATKIADAFEPKHTWELFGVNTANGTSATLRVQLPAKVNGVFVRVLLPAATNEAQFGAVVMTTARHGLGDIPNFISNNATSYGLIQYTRDGNFWSGYMTNKTAGAQGSPNMMQRVDNFVIDSADADYIEFRTQTTGAVLPEGSTFTIYVRR